MSDANDSHYSETLHQASSWHFRTALFIVSSVSLFCTLSCITTFTVLMAYSSHRINIPLVRITLSIQSVHALALVITLVFSGTNVTAELLCSSFRYILYTCYLSSIFMCCAITVHLWLVITRRKLNLTRRNERWYYIIPFTLAISLSTAIATIPNSAFRISNRCMIAVIPSREYLGIRWGLYYSWFMIASAISLFCTVGVLISVRRLTHTTYIGHGRYPASTDAYRNEVNARANSKRLRTIMIYSIAYPLISFVCNFPQLVLELLTTVLKRDFTVLNFVSLLLLYSQGFFLALVFFFYPAVLHSIRDIIHMEVQYWVVEQEEFWKQRQHKATFSDIRVLEENPNDSLMDSRDIRNFTSWRGRVYHFFLTKTSEGNRASIM